jgi:hypothetical protein
MRRRIQPSTRCQKRTSHFNIADPPLRARYHKYTVTGPGAKTSQLSPAILPGADSHPACSETFAFQRGSTDHQVGIGN